MEKESMDCSGGKIKRKTPFGLILVISITWLSFNPLEAISEYLLIRSRIQHLNGICKTQEKSWNNDKGEFSSFYWRIEFEYVESNSNILFGPKFEETVAKSLSSMSKSKKFFGALSQQQQQPTSPPPKEARKKIQF